ncbi:Uncharacterised protein [Serratia fonticola]|uniref:Uncharacterized protein n=1 Tax=Serratia fonticola TaxID=47917 RepID=A0A4U9W444_SERFO|nr:Uncharacterised protein [Serratia fonticola]
MKSRHSSWSVIVFNYKADGFTWHEQQLSNQGATTTTVEAQEFVEDNSGDNWYVDFPTLGISTLRCSESSFSIRMSPYRGSPIKGLKAFPVITCW